MAGIMLSQSFDSQTKKRNALYKKKRESPTIRDILRERGHVRIRERRGALLERFRQMGSREAVHQVLTNLLHEEIHHLHEQTCDEMEVVPNSESTEMNSHEDDWIIKEYEKILEEEEAMYSDEWDSQVICPLCERAVLKEDSSGSVACPHCLTSFPAKTMKEAQDAICKSIITHEQSCDEIPRFVVLNDHTDRAMFLICHVCGSFSQIL